MPSLCKLLRPQRSIYNEFMRAAIRRAGTRDLAIAEVAGFGLERSIASLGDLRLKGCDQNIWSATLGQFFAGQDVTFEFKHSHPNWNRISWMEDAMGDSPARKAATMFLCLGIYWFFEEGNVFNDRILKAYRDQWDALLDGTVALLENQKFRYEDFEVASPLDWLDGLPRSTPVASSPIYDQSNAKDIARDLKRLSAYFEWDYQEPADPRKILDKLTEFDVWGFSTTTRYSDMEENLRAILRPTNRSGDYYWYSNVGTKRLVTPHQFLQHFHFEPLQKEDEIGDEISIVTMHSREFSVLRSEFMNANIMPGSPSVSFAVLSNDKIVGAYAFSLNPKAHNIVKGVPKPTVYLLSDFPVSTSKYKRLAKLVLYAALSKETQLVLERMTNHRVRSTVTTAFSNKEVSMKYRGLFRMLNKSKREDWPPKTPKERDPWAGKRFKMNYGQLMGQWTLEEGLKEWKKKHGSVLVAADGVSENE